MNNALRAVVAIAAFIFLSATAALAQQDVGGFTNEQCTPASFTVTSGSAYTSGNEVGGLIALNPAFRPVNTGSGAFDTGGVVVSIRLDMKSVQTAGFKAYQFTAVPTTTFTDKTAPAINATDAMQVRPPITLSNNDSGLGTMTVYGIDDLARSHVAQGQTDYWLLTTSGTPTFTSTTDVKFCVTYLMD